VHESNARNLSEQLPLSQTNKTAMSLIVSYIFYSTKPENKREEQVLPGCKCGGKDGPNNVYTYE
jgi:hypothetical protein